ncbi:MAG: Pycsar system effector family protein [Thermodesulfobacteriota bacterium]
MDIQQPAGHLDQMIRQTRAHHVSLSSLADKKANMMLTIASLMIPLSTRFLYEEKSHLAAVTLIGFCVLTIVLAAYAAMPKLKIGNHKNSKVDKDKTSFNLLFFGSFTRMDYSEYENAMETMMSDPNKVYETQIREIYSMGHYLAQNKYKFVLFSYLSFITGILVSSTIYIIGSYT